MTTYKGIKGSGIQNLDSDAVADQVSGGAWASGGDLNLARYYGQGGGIQGAAIFSNGDSPAIDPATTNTESYDGTSWTEVANTSHAKIKRAAFGTQTSFLYAGGDPGAVTDT